jgi:hypothetical protein
VRGVEASLPVAGRFGDVLRGESRVGEDLGGEELEFGVGRYCYCWMLTLGWGFGDRVERKRGMHVLLR